MIRPPKFTEADAIEAFDAWGCNCGPAALAAVMGMTLDGVRPHLRGFDEKGYTNPTMMYSALRSIGRPWRQRTLSTWPCFGLARIQWEGPWTGPSVPIRARYRYTHWVGAARESRGIGIFDINALNNGSGWCSLADWSEKLAPKLAILHDKRATGAWHITHSLEAGAP
jgi:hypothetical protein